MEFIADFHIHSKFSRATSKDCVIPIIYKFSKIKGINIIGTGDFTHPGWLKELKEYLEPDSNGLLNLKKEIKNQIDKELPDSLKNISVKFILSAEISSIYKKNGAVRKIHNVILVPDFETAEELNKTLSKIGNLVADGRPILGLDSKELLEISLKINPDIIFIPAHIWTPWFSLFGSNSGFDSIEECFEDLTSEIFALETGLSSDPKMNWRLSALDRFNLVSNSDAHSPKNLAREANIFNTEISYYKIREALKNKNSKEFIGTIEFFPEEGKYHYDGHRSCNIRLSPRETIQNKYICPVCKKPVTVGVLHRVEKLADREEGVKPENAKNYESIVPLQEIIAESFGVNTNSSKVEYVYNEMIKMLGPELDILRKIPIDEIKKFTTPLIAEGIRRVRNNQLKILPGFDGEYGKIIIFSEEEKTSNIAQMVLLEVKKKEKMEVEKKSFETDLTELPEYYQKSREKDVVKLNSTQLKAVEELDGPVIVIAGPGTGKTFTLIEKIIFLITKNNVSPEKILAITFTNRAADEIKKRISKYTESNINIGTFHNIALSILKANNLNYNILDETDRRIILKELIKEKNLKISIDDILNRISIIKSNLINPDKIEEPEFRELFFSYQSRLNELKGMDYDDIIINVLKLFKSNPEILKNWQERFQYILVDEFQDVNLIEYKFITKLSKNGRNLFIIGDPDQSIYKFRGANPELFFKLKEDFKTSKVYQLKQNYRNPDFILKPSLRLISKISKNIKDENSIQPAYKTKDKKIEMIVTPTDLSAGIQIAKIITNEIGGYSMAQSDIINYSIKQRTFSDFAVLVRAGFLIPVIEEVFLKEGIPYKVYGETSFFDKSLPRLILNVLKLRYEQFNNFRAEQVLSFFKMKNIPHFSKIEDFINFIKLNLAEFGSAFEKTLNIEINENPSNFVKLFSNLWQDEEDFKKILEISENYQTIEKFLRYITLGKEQDIELSYEKKVETVSIMTMHSAKGLEFPFIFIFGFNQNLIPYNNSDIEEERRLLYVSMTRATEKLYLIASQKIKFFGKLNYLPVSEFSSEIEDYLQVINLNIDFKERKPEQLKFF